MRTTLNLPDDLYREVRTTAAATGRTVTSVVEEALRDALARYRAEQAGARTPFVVTPCGSGGLAPGVDLDDSAALVDVLEGR
ncbi:ribbon-helix-helix protein, CopG family [Cellulomonas shaoxiangyii]|uniref:Ribbon-helix-helix protein, CopG family n=1 Tax=Cellulomonas shaoxiangyii TaxID=2566013 RepID=A0A4P7SEQ9_9CELL|nr:ribbon-helix-helix protein, CopG family [Cellulomonas shaoxiangyii]QCB92629.1 ribbon-helix-helix protein, CopG family [Cellulomonas shaoxiangyii]TGY85437.1 ribbon-helix-helix protein, CopG family [Cellulomonas shaoxiangyii]